MKPSVSSTKPDQDLLMGGGGEKKWIHLPAGAGKRGEHRKRKLLPLFKTPNKACHKEKTKKNNPQNTNLRKKKEGDLRGIMRRAGRRTSSLVDWKGERRNMRTYLREMKNPNQWVSEHEIIQGSQKLKALRG